MIKLFRQLLQRNLYQMYWVSFPLEHTSNAEKGILKHGQPRFSISSAQACTQERILQHHLIVLILQQLLDRFSDACRHFGLTISLSKTQVMGQDIKKIPSLFIYNYKLEVVHEFVYLGLLSQTTCPSTVNTKSELERLP